MTKMDYTGADEARTEAISFMREQLDKVDACLTTIEEASIDDWTTFAEQFAVAETITRRLHEAISVRALQALIYGALE